MSLAGDLEVHAWVLLTQSWDQPSAEDVLLRRAISAAYYGLFHEIIGDAVALIAPNVLDSTNHRIQRWFYHAEIKRICGRFLAAQLDQPLLGLIGTSASPELQQVAKTFISLQEARHRADYDLGYKPLRDDTLQLLDDTYKASATWKLIKASAEANIFILSLLMWKNWERDRP